MRRLACLNAVLILVVLSLFTTSFALAQPPNLSGRWNLSASGMLVTGGMPCTFQGHGDMMQDGNQLSGQAELMLVSGPAECPAEMSANLAGMLDGPSFVGTLDGGQMFGMLNFSGMLGQDGRSLEGNYSVTSGPFMGTTGAWNSALVDGFLIPVLDVAGILLLTVLLAYTGSKLLRRKIA